MQRTIKALNDGAPVTIVDPRRLETAWNLWSDLHARDNVATDIEAFQAVLANTTALDTGAASLTFYIRSLLLKQTVEVMQVDVHCVQQSLFNAAAVLPFTGTELAAPEMLIQRLRRVVETAFIQ